MSNGIETLAKGLGEAIKTVPEVYDDGLKPTVKETGQTLAIIPRAIKAALSPLRQWIAEREYKVAETEKLLAIKLEHVGEEKIVPPEPYIAVPALQAISYSMDSEELKNLYANLLAKAMNSDTKDSVHPAFVEIIKQLSPLDATVFKKIMEQEVNPLIDLVYKNEKGQSITIATNISAYDLNNVKAVGVSIDNLIKQGLIDIPGFRSYTDERVYDSIINSDYYKSQQKAHPDTFDGLKFAYETKLIDKTNLGYLFYDICVCD